MLTLAPQLAERLERSIALRSPRVLIQKDRVFKPQLRSQTVVGGLKLLHELQLLLERVWSCRGQDIERQSNGLHVPLCLPNGRQKYRFVGLFDDDRAGREAVRRARELDKSAIEYRDVFRMRPVMPLHTDRDPSSLQKRFEAENLPYKGIDWELEDLLPESFHEAFVQACPDAIAKVTTAGGKTHRDLTRDGKAKFHRFVKENAVHADLKGLIATIRALRFYLGMPAL